MDLDFNMQDIFNPNFFTYCGICKMPCHDDFRIKKVKVTNMGIYQYSEFLCMGCGTTNTIKERNMERGKTMIIDYGENEQYV